MYTPAAHALRLAVISSSSQSGYSLANTSCIWPKSCAASAMRPALRMLIFLSATLSAGSRRFLDGFHPLRMALPCGLPPSSTVRLRLSSVR